MISLGFNSDLDLENFGKKKKKKKPLNLDDLKDALPDDKDDDLDLESFGKKKKKKKRGDAALDEAQDDNKENGKDFVTKTGGGLVVVVTL